MSRSCTIAGAALTLDGQSTMRFSQDCVALRLLKGQARNDDSLCRTWMEQANRLAHRVAK